jgi:hypothetical protein
MAKIVFDESYGYLTYAQRSCYRKCNVSPAMHRVLVERFGDHPAAITAFIKQAVAARGSIGYLDVLDRDLSI